MIAAGLQARCSAACWQRSKTIGQRQTSRDALLVCRGSRKGDVLLIAEGVGKSHDGDKQLFSGLTITIRSGQRLAVVGPNGAGKSTLLRILAGSADPDAGTLSRNKGAKVGYLPQGDILLDPAAQQQLDSLTVLQAVLASDSELARAVQEYQRVLASSAADTVTPELAAAIDRMNTLNAWSVDSEAKRMLDAVGLSDPNAKVGGLSGGQRRRLALAAALLGGPELLVMDEPTNHMDVDMITWMEQEILDSEDMALIMVSHDRYFMERTCNQLLELDYGQPHIHTFGGENSYTSFQASRDARRAIQTKSVADARTLHRREAEWMSRQPKARSTKAKARVDAFAELTERTRALPQADLKVDFGGVGMVRQGNKAIELKGVSYSTPTGKQLLDNFSFEFLPGERWGIAGRNGVGKSTVLDLIAGVKAPAGGMRDVGETAAIGYFTQYPPEVDGDLRMIDYIRSVADDRKARNAGQLAASSPETLLEQLGFPRKRQYQKVSSLSGGERRRLHLAAVLAGAPNILILDEPTNDLDLATVEVVEDVLAGFNGLLLVVSHDRAFMDNAVDRLLVLTGDARVRLFDGCYSEYLEAREAEEQRQAAAAAAVATAAGQAQDRAGSGASSSSKRGSSSSSSSKNGSREGTSSKSADASVAGSSSSSNFSSQAGSKQAANSSNGNGSKASSSTKAPSAKRKLGYFEEQEYKRIDGEVATLSQQRDALNQQLMAMGQQGSPDLTALESVSLEMAALQAKIEQLNDRWFELAEIAGDI